MAGNLITDIINIMSPTAWTGVIVAGTILYFAVFFKRIELI